MNTWKRTGHRRNYSNTGAAISAGAVVVMVDEIGIAVTDIAATTGTGDLSVSGVHNLPANSGEVWSAGDSLYWDVGNTELTAVSTGAASAGKADTDKVSADTTADILLNGRPGPQ